eukprot:TRINITY_DN2994_c0_g2_i1.p1 TRINITY_DN2994_c0_g2~~TRINITY_DN2994_c0_g2_i1.p1  ORF type:complete len:328 (+),score=70.88 TRINITY_DN2994_c0_g2_i1:65-1048(+)
MCIRDRRRVHGDINCFFGFQMSSTRNTTQGIQETVQDWKNFAYQKWLGISSKWQTPPETSQLLSNGILTPAEFVEAGDQLINISPIWEWKPAANPRLFNKYLPKDKQYLSCRVRCEPPIQHSANVSEFQDEKGITWIHMDFNGDDLTKEEEIKESEEEKKEEAAAQQPTFTLDLNDKYFNKNVDAPVVIDAKLNQNGDHIFKVVEKKQEKNREYDVSLVYDLNFYTPRMFLMGYEDGIPLPSEKMLEDISDQYAKKTVTVEVHPQLGENQATIHPCRHSEVMKKLIDAIIENGGSFAAHQYIILFLKVFSAVMPNIKYDTTLDYDLQ